MSEKGPKAGFCCAQKARKSQCSNGKVKDKRKERERRKEAEKRKNKIHGWFILFDGRGLFGVNFLKSGYTWKRDNVYKPKSARFLKWKHRQPVNTLENEQGMF